MRRPIARQAMVAAGPFLLAIALAATSGLAAKGGNGGGGGKPGGGDDGGGDAPAYSIVDLGPLPGGDYSEALAISDDGELVVGWSTIDPSGAYRGAVWEWDGTNWTVSELPTLGGDNSRALGVNTLGQVVGRAKDAAQYNQPVVWELGQAGWAIAHVLPKLGGPAGNAQGINEQGQVVGTSQLSCAPDCQPQHAVLWEFDGQAWQVTALEPAGAGKSLARDINGAGDRVVGFVDGRAWLWSWSAQSGWSDGPLGEIDGEGSDAYEINANDEVVGWSLAKRNSFWHGAIWRLDVAGGVIELIDLGTIKGRKNSRCYALNDVPQAVGESWLNTTASTWTAADGMSDLAEQIPADSGWSTLDEAQGISNTGRIAGIGVSPSGETHGFLLEPAP